MSPLSPQDVIEKIGELPTLPHLAVQMLRLSQDPDATPQDLQRLIVTDAALASLVLKIANSAMFGKVREVVTLSQAIMTLGFATIKSVVIASGAKALFQKQRTGLFQHLLWEHSLASALAGAAYGRELGYPTVEEAFLGALLHDIGKVVMATRFPDHCEAIAKKVYNGEADTLELELETFGFDHAMVGGSLLQAWNLAPRLVAAVRWHHDPAMAEQPDRPLASLVALGNQLALDRHTGLGRPEALAAATAQALAVLGMAEDAFLLHREKVIATVERDQALLTDF